MEQMATFMRAKTGANAAANIGSSWTDTVENCATFSESAIRHHYAMLAAVSYTSYEIQKWQAIEEYCDVLEYENGGVRPSVCQGINTNVPNLLAFKTRDCLGHHGFTRYHSVPAMETNTGNVTTPEDYARLNVTALLAGELVHFQVPNSDWLVKHGFIHENEKDYAIYVRQFEIYLPVESTFATSVIVRAHSMGGNSIVPGGTTYAVKSADPLVSEYEEGSYVNCRESRHDNPYNLCPSNRLSGICLASGYHQTEFIPPSIYTQWNLQVNGYEYNSERFARPGTDMNVQIAMTLCKKTRPYDAAVVNDEEDSDIDDEFPKCCSEDEYWSNELGECTPCPPGTVSVLRGYFCEDIDECQGPLNNCAQKCNNMIGSFECSCDEGFYLNDDGYTCADINECDDDFNICEHVCINTNGSYRCECNSGYSLSPDGYGCDVSFWPQGGFGLVQTSDGCPADFSEGCLQYDTEDTDNANAFQNVDLLKQGIFNDDLIKLCFCCKTGNLDVGPSEWPSGRYCIHRKGGDCPTGFQDGSINWDTENTSPNNAVTGCRNWNGANSRRIWEGYCCRDDGSIDSPISLPTSSPFVLYQYSERGCQEVTRMTSKEVFIKWDTENTSNGDNCSPPHPLNTGCNNEYQWLYMCHYSPVYG